MLGVLRQREGGDSSSEVSLLHRNLVSVSTAPCATLRENAKPIAGR